VDIWKDSLVDVGSVARQVHYRLLLTLQSFDPTSINFCALGKSMTADVVLIWYSYQTSGIASFVAPGTLSEKRIMREIVN
jgi:hypothetical protein